MVDKKIKETLQHDILKGIQHVEHFYLHVPECTPKEGDSINDFIFKVTPIENSKIYYNLTLYRPDYENVDIGVYVVNGLHDRVYELLYLYYTNKEDYIVDTIKKIDYAKHHEIITELEQLEEQQNKLQKEIV